VEDYLVEKVDGSLHSNGHEEVKRDEKRRGSLVRSSPICPKTLHHREGIHYVVWTFKPFIDRSAKVSGTAR
jgi:hypothetical protein